MRSRLKPNIRAAKTVAGHLENILTYITHHITDAITEVVHAKIQWIKYSSRGFRDRERFKLAIMFHCGGLDLEAGGVLLFVALAAVAIPAIRALRVDPMMVLRSD